MRKIYQILLIVAVAVCFLAPSTSANPLPDNWKPPKVVSLSSISVSSSQFITYSALFTAVTEKTGTQFRFIPGPTSLEREEKMRSGIVQFNTSTAAHAYATFRGVFDFNVKGWGPQPLRVVWSGDWQPSGFMTRETSNIKTAADIKGKRVASFIADEGMDANPAALLAYANLTWDDVKRTPVGSYLDGANAIIQGNADVCYSALTTKSAMELAASPNGIYWIPMPASDEEAWQRFHNVFDVWEPGVATFGAGISKDNPVDVMVWILYLTTDVKTKNELTYWVTKQIAENYESFKDRHATLANYTIDQCLDMKAFKFPFHEGSIMYFKEIGKWTPEHEARQQELLASGDQMRADWEKEHPGW